MKNRVVAISGAGRGVGRAEALLLAEQGVLLVLNDLGCDVDGSGRDPSVVDAVVREVRAKGGEAIATHEDIGAPGAADRLVARALEQFGRLDAVIMSAGINRERSILKMEDDDLLAFWNTHVRASFAITRAAGQCLVTQGDGGAILLTTTPAAFFGAARGSHAAAAGAAIAGLTRSAAVELRKHGIRVNAVAPTARTRQTENSPTFRGIHTESMTPAHVAQVALFLISDLARELTGEVVGVAGARVYVIRSRESAGAFVGGDGISVEETDGEGFDARAIADAWDDIARS